MNTSKKSGSKSSDTDQALARPGTAVESQRTHKSGKNISPDAILAEKDEVKNAEEELKQRKESTKGDNNE